MPSTIQAAVPSGKIVFELERFEYDGERLALSGRWFGVRGRRFVRPTLTLLGASERSRALADLEHKPWAAEDGGPWEAAFPWARESRTAKFELSVTPDIAVQLPSPGAKRSRRRIAAEPRAAGTLSSTSTLAPSWDGPEQVEPPPPPRDPELERLESELAAAKAELAAVVGELEASRTMVSEREGELEAVREELATTRAGRESVVHETAEAIAARDHVTAERDQLMIEREKLAAEREQLTAERGQLQSHHDALASDRAEVITERDQLMIERDRLVTELREGQAERDRQTKQMRQMAGDHDQTRQGIAKLQSQLEGASVALQAANRERDEAVAARGAALVMRRAAGTPPNYQRPGNWWKTTLAVLALFGVMFAILIVAHVL